MDGFPAYLDASVVLRRVLEQPGAIEDWSSWGLVVASELMPVEVYRTLDRMRLVGDLTPAKFGLCVEEFQMMTAGLQQVPLSRTVLRRAAGPFSAPLGTLDAIHLATALLWIESNDEELTLVTHDRQLAAAARACGLHVRFAS